MVGGVWFAATPGSNDLTMDRQDPAADADFRAQAQGQLLAASHESVREFVATIPLASGEQPGRDDHSVSLLAASGNAGLKENNNGTNPDNTIAEPTAAIPHRPGERVVDGSFATDGEVGSRQEQVDRYAHGDNADRPETEAQAKIARLQDLWAPRYADAKAAHKLPDNSVAQAMAYSEAYFASQQERIAELNSEAQIHNRPQTRMSSLLEIQREQSLRWKTQATATLEQSEALLAEMSKVNQSLRFAEDASDYDAMVVRPSKWTPSCRTWPPN